MEVMVMDGVLGNLIAVVVGSAVAQAAPDDAAGEKAGEAIVVVGAAARGRGLPRGAAELGVANDIIKFIRRERALLSH